MKRSTPLYAALDLHSRHITMEAGALTRWASGIVRPLVDRLIICEPRHNRLINSNPTKSDEADVEGMCLLLRLGKLKEVWMGTDRTREIYRALVYELLNWRDAQRELKALIKARYRQWGVLRLHGIRVFSLKGREEYLAQLPAEEERRMMRRLYRQLDHALEQWKETREEVERVGGSLKSHPASAASSSSGNTASWGSPIAPATTNRWAISGWTGGEMPN